MIAIKGFYMMMHVFTPGFFKKEEKAAPYYPENPSSIDKLFYLVKQAYPDFVPVSFSYKRSEKGYHTMSGHKKDQMFLYPAYSGFISFDDSCKITEASFIENSSRSEKTERIIYSLHFGNYGGIAIKILYTFFGLTPSLLLLPDFCFGGEENVAKVNNDTVNTRQPLKEINADKIDDLSYQKGLRQQPHKCKVLDCTYVFNTTPKLMTMLSLRKDRFSTKRTCSISTDQCSGGND